MTKFCSLRAPNIHYCTVYMSQLLSLKWNSVKLNSFQLDFSLSHNSIIQPFFQAFINYNFLCTWEIVPIKERTWTLLIITWHGCSKCTKLVLKPLAAKNGRSISVLCTDFSPYIRDDTHMPSMKIVQFSRPHTPPCPSTTHVVLRPIFFHPLDLGRAISSDPPRSPNDNQSIKRKQSKDEYYMLPGPSFRSVFVFSINSLILSSFPWTSIHLAEASLSAFLWLYILVYAVVNCVQLFTF